MAPQRFAPFGRRGRQPTAPAAPDPAPAPPRISDPALTLLSSLPLDEWSVSGSGQDDEILMSRFLGPDWAEYQFLWRLMRSNGALIPSFSFAAFSFSFAWLFYRRLYLAGLAAMAIQIEMTRHSPINAFIGGLLLSMGVGFFGKALVLQRGMKLIGSMQGEGGARISALGETRLAPALVSIVLVASIGIAEQAEKIAHRIEAVPAFSENGLRALSNAR